VPPVSFGREVKSVVLLVAVLASVFKLSATDTDGALELSTVVGSMFSVQAVRQRSAAATNIKSCFFTVIIRKSLKFRVERIFAIKKMNVVLKNNAITRLCGCDSFFPLGAQRESIYFSQATYAR
jgi:hypothetical protein